ncbi:MAG: hypothetical protein JSU85_01675 [Candidatus Zixiibacteriota bacterium]|nr:MAG: hypothetical protein JSU85_01675 [candidate division Zixibacteria bacterium]
MRKLTGISLLTAMFAIFAINAFSDETKKTPVILEGKIWGGSDTLNLGKSNAADSIISLSGDTAITEMSEEEINWSSEDVIELDGKSISSKADLLRLRLSLPRTLKFIKDAPVKLAAKSSNTDIIEIGEGAGDDPEKGFAFPLSVNPGTADLYLYYRVVCCTIGTDAVCFFKEAKLKIPVTVGNYKDEVLIIHRDIER